MKKIVLSICSLVVLSLLYISCSKDDIKPNKKEGSVEFGFSLKAPSHSGAQKSSMKALAAEPAAIVVSIKKANGNSAYTMQKVDLYNMNGYYISKPLSLLQGDYTIEQFFVVDAVGNVMYATPLQGSSKAYLVSQPLPISFTVSKDAVTKLVPEVLSTVDSTPEDFGYSTFSFEVVNTFDFLIGVFVYNESTQNFELTNANLTIVAASKTIYTDTLAAITNKVTVNDGYDFYRLTITKDGYKSWVDSLSEADLKLYFRSEDKGPLEVILEKDCGCPTTVVDIDGNVYHTVTIGTQCWMVENLKTTRYNDGTAIPNVTDETAWNKLTSGAYCWYNNDQTNKNPYGALYNWHAVKTGKLAPQGWHVPTIQEFQTLVIYLGGACGSLKETGFIHWESPNGDATNNTGFTAVPGGARVEGFSFNNKGYSSYGWTTTEENDSTSYVWSLRSYDGSCFTFWNGNQVGYAVRCIKN